ncbi:MAG: AMP-binding protein, partial [Candidatus Methanomethylophilaceae archaeon]|nr:AMP-binding protein [Candidatus Methanomethylophilaceae archaeon]
MGRLNDYAASNHVTGVCVTAQVGRIYVNGVENHALKNLMVGGEMTGFIDPPPGLRVIDAYGPTECTIFVSQTDVTKKNSPRSVGRPNANLRLYVLDAEKRMMPRGAAGELHVSGVQVSSGYLNREDLNSKAFIENPFTNDPRHSRMYCTGDFARILPDGTVEMLGRRDGQVKIRGNRVELTEIEATIRDVPGVTGAVVQAIANGPGKELCAYVVGDVDGEEVKRHVGEEKPPYMVPTYVVKVDSIPLNINGKVDWKALPKPNLSESRAEYVAPRNHAEAALCKAFENVLNVDDIGIDDDFIRLGGDSLKAIRVQNESRVSTTVDVLRYRTPRAIAEHSASMDFDRGMFGFDGGCPLNESQMNVYLDIEANGKYDAYLIPFAFDIPAGATEEDAKDALEKVLEAYPVLSSRITDKNGEPWLVFDAKPEVRTDEPESPVLSRCLSSFSVSDGKIRGLISHIVFDGMSYAVLADSLSRAFAGETLERDDGVLVSSAFDRSVKGDGRFAEAERMFDSMLCDGDADSGLVGDSGRPGELTQELSSRVEDIKRFAKSCGSSMGTLMTSVFAYTVSRFSGRSDSVFCVLNNGRSLPGLERSVGMFVRTVPVRIDCSDRSIKEFVSMASKTAYGSIASGFVPFRELSGKYGVKADVLFQHMPAMEYSVDGSSDSNGAGGIADLIAITAEHQDKVRLILSHSSRFSDEYMDRFAKTFDDVLAEMLTKEKLSDIRYRGDIPARGESRALNHYSAIDAFRESVGRSPGRMAVASEGRSLTYSEADAVTDGIASKLSGMGVRAGDKVAVLVPRGEWYYLCAIGVLKTGAAYVPMDDAYPDERLSFMAEDSGVAVTLVTPETAGRAAAMGLKTIDCASCVRKTFEPVEIDPASPAVILYTSGTTGKPKGSVITHRAIDNMCEWYVGYTDMDENDVYSLYTSYSFDINTIGLFSPLYRGASVDVVPERVRLDMAELNGHFVDAGTTHTFMTTQIGKLFASMDMPSGIKALMYGGEKLGEFRAPEHLGAIETYGPSENLALSTAVMVNDRNYPDSVGRLLPNIKAYVLDAEKRIVPCGAVGELHLSGYQLSLGYLNRDDLNSKVFLRNPFSEEPGFERMYATGDFFRVLPDGTLGVIGRRDGQVKIRGNRVELTEIEAAIRDMPGIRDVTVQAVASGPGKELCAYVVGEADAEAVKAWVAERKPSYMVPAFVVSLESIPRNVNGKVDRRALPDPDVSSLKAEYAAPRNEGERKVCEAMATILGAERVGIDDDFIRLGGDSLKAVRLAAACRSMGITVPAQEVIARRTVRSLSPMISSAVDAGPYSGPVGLSPVQERFMSSGTASQRDRHNQSVVLRSSERIDLEVLQKALDAVTDHHDMLRALYSRPYAVRPPGVRVCEARADPASDREQMSKAMDLAQGSLSLKEGRNMACLLFSLESDYVFITIHHMVVDGASWSIILDDLSSAYRSIKAGGSPRLPPRTSSYATWLDPCSDPLRKEESEYWKAADSFVPESVGIVSPQDFSLVSDFPLPSAEDGPFGFDSADILAAALAEAFSELTGEDGVTIRMEGHGRVLGDVERTVGWFTDMYPLRLTASGDPLKDLFEARKRLHEVPRGGIGYESERHGRPLPQITLNYLSDAFRFSDGLFETVFDIPMGRSSDVPPDDRISLNVNDVGGMFAVTGYHDGSDVMSRLPEAFMKAIGRISKAAAEPEIYMRPLSEGQLNVYLDEMAESKGTGYNAPGMVSIKGIPTEKVRKAVEAVIEAHPVLKSRITEYEGVPWMVADSYPEISEGPLEGFARPFDLGGCLSRFRISEEFLVWDVHHAIMDASSRNVLIRDIRDALSGKDVVAEARAFDVSAWHSPESIWKAEEFFDGMLDGADTDPGLVPDL